MKGQPHLVLCRFFKIILRNLNFKKIQIGDQLMKIDGESTENMTHQRAITLIKERQEVDLLLRREKI